MAPDIVIPSNLKLGTVIELIKLALIPKAKEIIVSSGPREELILIF